MHHEQLTWRPQKQPFPKYTLQHAKGDAINMPKEVRQRQTSHVSGMTFGFPVTCCCSVGCGAACSIRGPAACAGLTEDVDTACNLDQSSKNACEV